MIQDLTNNGAFTKRRNNTVLFRSFTQTVSTNMNYYKEYILTGDHEERFYKNVYRQNAESESGVGVRLCHRCGQPVTLTPWNIQSLHDDCLCQRCNIELEQQCSGTGWYTEEKPWLLPNDENTRPLDNIFVWD